MGHNYSLTRDLNMVITKKWSLRYEICQCRFWFRKPTLVGGSMNKYNIKLNLKKKKKSPLHDGDNKTDQCFNSLCRLFLTSSKRGYSLVLHISMYPPHLLTSFIHLSSRSVTNITLPFSASQCRLPVWPDWLVREQLPWQVRAPWMGPALAPAPILTAPRESEQSPRPWRCLAKWGMRHGGGGWGWGG